MRKGIKEKDIRDFEKMDGRKTKSHWDYHYVFDDFTCNNCGYSTDVISTKCPNCGAEMVDAKKALRRQGENRDAKEEEQ